MPNKCRATIIAFIALLACFAATGPAQAQHAQMTPVLNAYFKMVFAGDVSGAAALFASNPDDQGTKMLAGKFTRRFVERSDGIDLAGIDSPVVIEIAELFQTYWRDAMMQTASLEVLEGKLTHHLDRLLVERGFATALDDEDILLENIEALIRDEGYFAQSGRTPPLLELMIWTKDEVVNESVELTDGTYEVDLHRLDGFASYGWSNFAAFGMTRTGGWAEKDGLYCLCGNYDLDSERFELSFLKHETRHFADYELYPELQASDLEYRGKLTELAFSKEGTYELLAHFANSANRVENAPHPLANWYVIEGLSRLLLEGKQPVAASAWTLIPKQRIRLAARQLLEAHDVALAEMGPKTTTGIVNL